MPFLDINQEREHAYAGYAGMLTFARELCRTLESPIWSAVRSSAPWLEQSGSSSPVPTAVSHQFNE
ncbi:hypothetical protein P4S72_21660 [Vibrio sp. PP-XX7]